MGKTNIDHMSKSERVKFFSRGRAKTKYMFFIADGELQGGYAPVVRGHPLMSDGAYILCDKEADALQRAQEFIAKCKREVCHDQ